MIKKFFVSLFLLCPGLLLAEVCDEHHLPGDLDQISRSLGRVNCNTSVNLMLDSGLQRDEESQTCGSCKSQFLSPIENQHRIDHDRLLTTEKKVFVKALFNELQKSIAITTSEIMALSDSSELNLTNATKKCDMRSFERKIQSCGAVTQSGVSLDSFKDEVFKNISKDLSPISPAACSQLEGLSQAQIDQLSREAAIYMLNESTFSAIEKFNGNSSAGELPVEFQTLLAKDPFFKALLRKPEEFKTFFLGLKNLSPQQRSSAVNDFKKSSGMAVMLDEMFSDQCDKALKSFSDTVCAPDFNSDRIDLGGFENYTKVNLDNFDDKAAFATTPEVEERNFELLSFCNQPDFPSSKYKLSEKLMESNNWMFQDIRQLNLKSFSEQTKNERARTNQRICEANCSQNLQSSYCHIRSLLQTNNSSQVQVAQVQYGGGALNLLRSILGTPTKISPEDKEVLVSYGILPQDDGSFVTPPSQTQVAQVTSGAGSTGAASARGAASNTRATTNAQFAESQNRQGQRNQQPAGSSLPYNPVSSSAFSSAFAEQLDNLSNLTDQERQRLSDFEREISRRLSGPGSSSTPTRAQVQQVAQNVVRERAGSLSPQRQQQLINSYVGAFDQIQNTTFAPAFANTGGATLGNDLAGPSQAYINEQNAKAAMARSQRAGSSGSVGGRGGDASLSAAQGRSPASTTEGDSPSVSVRISLDELQLDPQRALSQLPASLPESFIIEVQGTSQVYRYQVSRSGAEFQVSQLGSDSGRALIERIQRLLNSRRAELSGLRQSLTRAN